MMQNPIINTHNIKKCKPAAIQTARNLIFHFGRSTPNERVHCAFTNTTRQLHATPVPSISASLVQPLTHSRRSGGRYEKGGCPCPHRMPMNRVRFRISYLQHNQVSLLLYYFFLFFFWFRGVKKSPLFSQD